MAQAPTKPPEKPAATIPAAPAVGSVPDISSVLDAHPDELRMAHDDSRDKYVPPDQENLLKPYATTGNTVTIACKIACGLELRLFEMADDVEPVLGGGSRSVKKARAVGEPIRINGFSNPVNSAPKTLTYGGFGMTYGVPQEFWERWVEQNKSMEIVQKGLIFALPNNNDTQLEARERAALRSGQEPLDPNAKLRVGAFVLQEAER